MLGERQGWSSEPVLVARDAAQAVLSSPGDPFGLCTQIPEPGPLSWARVGGQVMPRACGGTLHVREAWPGVLSPSQHGWSQGEGQGDTPAQAALGRRGGHPCALHVCRTPAPHTLCSVVAPQAFHVPAKERAFWHLQERERTFMGWSAGVDGETSTLQVPSHLG